MVAQSNLVGAHGCTAASPKVLALVDMGVQLAAVFKRLPRWADKLLPRRRAKTYVLRKKKKIKNKKKRKERKKERINE